MAAIDDGGGSGKSAHSRGNDGVQTAIINFARPDLCVVRERAAQRTNFCACLQ